MPTPRTMPIPHPRPTVPAPRRHTVRHRHRTTTHQHNNKRNPENDTTTIPTSIGVRPTTGHIRLPLATIRQIPKPRTHNTNRARENHATPLNARYTTQFHHTDTKTNRTENTTTMNVKVKKTHTHSRHTLQDPPRRLLLRHHSHIMRANLTRHLQIRHRNSTRNRRPTPHIPIRPLSPRTDHPPTLIHLQDRNDTLQLARHHRLRLPQRNHGSLLPRHTHTATLPSRRPHSTNTPRRHRENPIHPLRPAILHPQRTPRLRLHRQITRHTPTSPVPSTTIDDTGPFSFPQTTPPHHKKKAPRQPSRPAEGIILKTNNIEE